MGEDSMGAEHVKVIGEGREELLAKIRKLEADLRAANADADMYHRAWSRELGTVYNKGHAIDALVITTRAVVAANREMFRVLSKMRDDLHTKRLADYLGIDVPPFDLHSYTALLAGIDQWGGKLR
jgi:hypothetical protein